MPVPNHISATVSVGGAAVPAAIDHRLAAMAANGIASSAARPPSRAATRPTPAAGKIGDALLGWIASSSPSRAAIT
jgi:hypothetical protein